MAVTSTRSMAPFPIRIIGLVWEACWSLTVQTPPPSPPPHGISCYWEMRIYHVKRFQEMRSIIGVPWRKEAHQPILSGWSPTSVLSQWLSTCCLPDCCSKLWAAAAEEEAPAAAAATEEHRNQIFLTVKLTFFIEIKTPVIKSGWCVTVCTKKKKKHKTIIQCVRVRVWKQRKKGDHVCISKL